MTSFMDSTLSNCWLFGSFFIFFSLRSFQVRIYVLNHTSRTLVIKEKYLFEKYGGQGTKVGGRMEKFDMPIMNFSI